MRIIKVLFLLSILLSCNTGVKENIITEEERKAFGDLTKNYQKVYMEGAKNEKEIISKLDKSVVMWENDKMWSFDDMVRYVPYLTRKNIIVEYYESKIITPTKGYDFCSIIYLDAKADTMRETTSRFWENIKGDWKIVKMNNLVKRETK